MKKEFNAWFRALFPTGTFNYQTANPAVVQAGYIIALVLIVLTFLASSYLLMLGTEYALAAIPADALAAMSNVNPMDAAPALDVIAGTSEVVADVAQSVEPQAASFEPITQQEYQTILADYKNGNLNYSFG